MSAQVQDLSAWNITPETLYGKLDAQRQAFLAKQGWSPEILARFGINFYHNLPTNGAAPFWHPKLQGQLKAYNYIGIPYLDINGAVISRYVFAAGTEIPFRRVRLLDFTEKHGKYQSYALGGTAIFIPHDSKTPAYWDKIAIDPKTPIMLTEGEFDAISGCLLGVPTLGLSGLDCFIEKGTREPTCGGKEFAWKGRTVYICPDQDKESTHEAPFKGQSTEGAFASVAAAAARLADNLSLLGATPHYVYLVNTKVGKANLGSKIGLSEYLMLGGTKEDLLATVVKVSTGHPEVIDLLNKYAVLGPDVIELETSKIITSKHFDRVHANKQVWVATDRGPRPVPATDLWLKHPKRYTVRELVFRPDAPSGMQPDSTFNLWRGFAVQPGTLGSEKDAEIFAALELWCETMWGKKLWPWVRGHYTHMMLHPALLRQHMPILQSKTTGIGKSTFFQLFVKLIGPAHAVVTDLDRFFGKFNLQYAGMLLVFIDEIEATKGQSVRIRRQITSDTLEVEGKNKDTYTVPWCGALCAATNSKVAVHATAEDRRICQATPEVPEDFKKDWQPRIQEIIELVTAPESLPVVMSYFTNPEWVIAKDGTVIYDPLADAPRTDSFEQSLEAARGMVEQAGELFFEWLPEIFAFTTETSAGIDSVTGPTKAMIDYVKEKAASRALLQVRMCGHQKWISVFKKHETAESKLPVVINSQGKPILAGDNRVDMARIAYDETNAVVLKFTNRDLKKELAANGGEWTEV